MGESLKHKDPDTYAKDLKDALDEFEDALVWRYEEDLYHLTKVWTTHGEEPVFVTPTRDQYLTARDYAPAWAAEGRDQVSKSIADYGTQDLNKLESAVENLRSASELLGEGRAASEEDDIFTITTKINGQCDFDGWAGASGEAFRKNFGESTSLTLVNQAQIAENLISLYSARTCIIESVRRNTVNALKRAATALRETEDSGEETDLWFFIGVASIPLGFVVTAGAGAVIAGVGAIAGLLDSNYPDQKFSNDIKEIVSTLEDQLKNAGSDASFEEGELFEKTVRMQQDLEGAKSEVLELYDFTGGEYSAAAPAGGFTVSAEDVYDLSELCFTASQVYENVITKAVSTDDADGELKGEGYVETAADAELKDTKDAFVSFVKTTCARYYEAGERLHDTARTYFGVEADNEKVFKGFEDDPDLNGADRDGNGGSVDKHVKKTNRDDIEDVTDTVDPVDPPYVHG